MLGGVRQGRAPPFALPRGKRTVAATLAEGEVRRCYPGASISRVAGARMGHDWVFDVLEDLADYAERNGLPRLARKAAEALVVARDEIGAGEDDGTPGAEGGRSSLH